MSTLTIDPSPVALTVQQCSGLHGALIRAITAYTYFQQADSPAVAAARRTAAREALLILGGGYAALGLSRLATAVDALLPQGVVLRGGIDEELQAITFATLDIIRHSRSTQVAANAPENEPEPMTLTGKVRRRVCAALTDEFGGADVGEFSRHLVTLTFLRRCDPIDEDEISAAVTRLQNALAPLGYRAVQVEAKPRSTNALHLWFHIAPQAA